MDELPELDENLVDQYLDMLSENNDEYNSDINSDINEEDEESDDQSNSRHEDEQPTQEDGEWTDDQSNSQDGPPTEVNRRAHHNALERKRRDEIKGNYRTLKDSIPYIKGKKASRVQILQNASEYIMHLKQQNKMPKRKNEFYTKQNKELETQIKILENMVKTKTYDPRVDWDLLERDSFDENEESEVEELPPPPAKRKRAVRSRRS